jgi:hypothetical protein
MEEQLEIQLQYKREVELDFLKLFFEFHGKMVLFANKFTCDMLVSRDVVQDAFH